MTGEAALSGQDMLGPPDVPPGMGAFQLSTSKGVSLI